MSKEYKAKVFKSGNSVALRLPKALGIRAGSEVILREEHGAFSFEPVPETPKKIDLSGIAGSIPWLQPIRPDDREFEERELDWEGKRRKRD